MTVRPYRFPPSWIAYDTGLVHVRLIEAKSKIQALRLLPYQQGWVDQLQDVQLKREIEGTSRIEGAEFGEGELEAALAEESPEESLNRSQRQARSAQAAYKWMTQERRNQPVTESVVLELHNKLVTGADDDHCQPGRLRGPDDNVTFGRPRHRGATGGEECKRAFSALLNAVDNEFRNHDVLIQAMALHYHLAAIHPFGDGNGRTARATEAWVLRREELKDDVMIGLSNYYYDNKEQYLEALSQTYESKGDLTHFILFCLQGVIERTNALFNEIVRNLQKELFRNFMHDLSNRLQSKRKRVVAKRQIAMLRVLLEKETLHIAELADAVDHDYASLKASTPALVRDLWQLLQLGAVSVNNEGVVTLNLDWPKQLTDSKEFDRILGLPIAKSDPTLRGNLRRWVGKKR